MYSSVFEGGVGVSFGLNFGLGLRSGVVVDVVSVEDGDEAAGLAV